MKLFGRRRNQGAAEEASRAQVIQQTAGKVGDLELARRALAGEREAVDRFVERMRCIPRALQIKNARMGSPLSRHDTDDLAQEVFSAVWAKLETFRGEAALESWAYRFCVMKLMNSVKRLGRRSVPLGEVDGALPAPEEPRTEALDYEHVYAGLGELDPALAELVELKLFEGLTFDEIGGLLGITTNTAKTRYYRALKRLRGLLAPKFGLRPEGEAR